MTASTTPDPLADFERRDYRFGGRSKPVLVTGDRGPAVVVIHEVFGMTPPLARFCRWVRDAGLRVYAPILLVDAPGEPTRAAADEVVAFFRERLGASAPPEAQAAGASTPA